MSDYVMGMHTKNGLLNKVQSSTTTTLNAEEKIVWYANSGLKLKNLKSRKSTQP